jgi:hypothetical protein
LRFLYCARIADEDDVHIQPVALGGTSTVSNIRLTCRAHNILYDERVFGREHMARFRRTREPEVTSPGRSGSGAFGLGDPLPASRGQGDLQ